MSVAVFLAGQSFSTPGVPTRKSLLLVRCLAIRPHVFAEVAYGRKGAETMWTLFSVRIARRARGSVISGWGEGTNLSVAGVVDVVGER